MRRVLPLAIGVIALIIVTAIAITNSRGSSAPGPIRFTETVQPTVAIKVQTTATPVPAKVDVGSVGSPRVLAWNPNLGQLAWIGKDGKIAQIGQSNKSTFTTCGLTPNGDNMIVFQGNPMMLPLNGNEAVPLGSNVALACALPGRTQVSPDGNRVAMLKFDAGTASQRFAAGQLQIMKLSDGSMQGTIDNVIAFDLQNDGVTAIQLFTNTKGQAKTGDLVFWDGSKIRKIEENFGLMNTDEKADCEFVAARVLRINERVYELFGEKCKQGGNNWRIRRIDFSGANPTDLVKGITGSNGAATYFNNAATNEMYVFPDNNNILFTVPNGIAADLANVGRVSISDGTYKDVIQSVAVDNFPSDSPSQFLRSPDGKFYAFVTRSGDKTEQLYLYDLTQPDKAPVAVTSGGKLDRITGLAWQKDGQRLFYTIIGDTQAMYYYGLKGESNLLVRGTFSGLAVMPDGSQAVTSEHIKSGTNDFHESLTLVNIGDESKTVLVEGAKGEKPLVPILVR